MTITCQLPRSPRLKLIFYFLKYELEARGHKLSQALGFGRPQHIDMASYAAPDSALAKEAHQYVKPLYSEAFFNHCHRTYAFATAFAEHHRRRFDRELLYVACMLHDLGFTKIAPDDDRFELTGARVAYEFCLAEGMSPSRAALVHEAVAFHTACGIAEHMTDEVALLHLGVCVDVAGLRIERLAKSTVDAVLDEWPRKGFGMDFYRLIEEQSQTFPHTDVASSWALGFANKVKSVPFIE